MRGSSWSGGGRSCSERGKTCCPKTDSAGTRVSKNNKNNNNNCAKPSLWQKLLGVSAVFRSSWQLEEEVFWSQKGDSSTRGKTQELPTGVGSDLQQALAPAASQRQPSQAKTSRQIVAQGFTHCHSFTLTNITAVRRITSVSFQNELIIQIMTESHEIDGVKRKIEDGKMKLLTEIKVPDFLRNSSNYYKK